MFSKKASIIVKIDFVSEQTISNISKFVGLTKARYLVPVIDSLNLDANPRSSKTGTVTEDIQDSIKFSPEIFPFKTKGILLASSGYKRLDRGRIRIEPDDPEIEGILDGGHNTLAIGLYILQLAMRFQGESLPRGVKTWDDFKRLWQEKREVLSTYLTAEKQSPEMNDLDFYVPVELLVPRDAEDPNCVESFKNELLDICAARNNNVQLQISAKANQLGYFETLKQFLEDYNPAISSRVEWKTNDGGDIKVQDIVALAWIPLNLITPVKDSGGRTIEPVSPPKIYAAKGSCLKQFEKLMSSPEVTVSAGEDYRHHLQNSEVESAFRIAVELPSLYDYIYEMFPKLYNAAGGSYGRITTVKNLNEKRREPTTPFTKKPIETLSPDGFTMPLIYGLQALMERASIDGHDQIRWKQSPWDFLHKNLADIVANYAGILSICDYDPQKVGKTPQSYTQALSAFKMAVAGIL